MKAETKTVKARLKRQPDTRRRNRQPRRTRGYEYQMTKREYDELTTTGGCADVLEVMAYLNADRGLKRPIRWITITD